MIAEAMRLFGRIYECQERMDETLKDFSPSVGWRGGIAREADNLQERHLKWVWREFSGGPVIRSLHLHCQGYIFDPWSVN